MNKKRVEEFKAAKTASQAFRNGLQDVPENSTPGPATTPTQGPPKSSEDTTGQDLHPPDLSTQNIVTSDIVYETDEEEFGDVADSMELDERQKYKEDVVEEEQEQGVVYETDEEEFMQPGRCSPTTTTTPATSVLVALPKRKRGRTSKQRGYQLAYFTLWWSRMLREGVKEEEARRNKEERDQHIGRWTTWATRSGDSTLKTDVICEQPLRISKAAPDVNTLFVGRGDALITGGTSEGNCGWGVVTVGNDTHLMDEAQNISTSIFDEAISEQHHEGSLNTGTGANLAENLVWGHVGVL